jgi:hypothetical protein
MTPGSWWPHTARGYIFSRKTKHNSNVNTTKRCMALKPKHANKYVPKKLFFTTKKVTLRPPALLHTTATWLQQPAQSIILTTAMQHFFKSSTYQCQLLLVYASRFTDPKWLTWTANEILRIKTHTYTQHSPQAGTPDPGKLNTTGNEGSGHFQDTRFCPFFR